MLFQIFVSGRPVSITSNGPGIFKCSAGLSCHLHPKSAQKKWQKASLRNASCGVSVSAAEAALFSYPAQRMWRNICTSPFSL